MADKPESGTAAPMSTDAAERSGGRERTTTTSSTGMVDSTPYQARRVATAATVPDDLAPSGSGPHDSNDGEEAKPPPKPFIDRVLGKIGLTVPLMLMMFKGSLAPTIGIAMYQADAINTRFPTLGYLIPIVTLLSMTVLPRGKFVQMLALNLFFICFGSAVAMLIMYSGVKARENTSAPLTQEQLLVYQTTGVPPYNSSQSAVMGVWLFVAIYFGNLLRAKLPALNVPVIIYSILISVATTYGPAMVTMTTCKSFVKQILTAMLFAQGLSTGVSLFVFPTTSRQVLMTQMTGTIGLLRKAVKLQGEYLQGLEREDMYALATVETAVGDLGPAVENGEKKKRWWWPWGKKDEEPAPPLTKEAKAAHSLRTTIGALHELTGKMQTELRFAKRDAAFGKLSSHDLGVIMRQLRDISIPVTGMSTIMDIFRRTAENRGWNEPLDEKTTLNGSGSSDGKAPTTNDSEEGEDDEAAGTSAEARAAAKALALEQERHVWNEIMKKLHEPFTILSDTVDTGLEHAGLQLGLLPRTKEQKARYREQRKRKIATGVVGVATATASPAAATAASGRPTGSGNGDIEAALELQPGDEGFAVVVDQKVEQFHSTRNEILRVWARERGLIVESGKDQSNKIGLDPVFLEKETRQSQLYVLLYMEQLMQATGKAVQDLVMLADQRVADGTMDKRRLMYPTLRRLRKWVISVLRDHEDTNGGDESPDAVERSNNVVYMGDGFGAKHDPEHMPPTNAWQRFGNGIRAVSRLLGSQESLFGLRAACATMSIGIICFLEPTQTFFRQQRLVWAMIMIAIAMSQTSGQSIFGFFCRVGGSFLATVFCYIIWYITGQKTPGVIVFLWLFLFCEFYFLFKYPRFVAACMIMLVTQVLIVGYELQVRRIGVAKSESSGQHYYPIYELAPYRLATVAAGCFVAFIWTIFPQPMTDRAWLRRDLSATMYLLANYFSAINETLRAAMEQTAGDISVRGTPAYQLQKVRRKLFSKLMVLLPSLQAHSNWQRWEPAIGGRYPREAYEDIILRASRILNYLTLVSYTVTWKPQHVAAGPVDTQWLQTLAQLMRSIGPTHYTILSTLTLLSNSLLSGQSLPPYIPLPRPYELTQHLLTLMEHGSDNKDGDPTGKRVGSQNGRRQSDARMACWQSVAGKEDSPGAGLSDLMRIPTRTASSLGRVLDASNLEHTGYTEFAVLQVCSTLVCDDLEGLIHTVSELVGVVDFSFRVHTDNGKSKAD